MMFPTYWPTMAVLLVTSLPRAVLSDLHACSIPTNFTIMVGEGSDATVIGAELWVGIKTTDISVSLNLKTSSAAIVAGDIIVAFRGKMFTKYLQDGIETEIEKVSRIHDGPARGSAKLTDENGGNFGLRECQLFLSPKDRPSGNIPTAVDNKIRRLAELCIGQQVCKHLDTIEATESSSFSRDFADDLGPLSPASRALNVMPYRGPINELGPMSTQSRSSTSVQVRVDPLQTTINTLVDIALAEIIAKLKKKNEGIINIPDIHEVFTKGSGFFRLKGHFDATNGTFEDLTTLKRTEDAVLSHTGFKFSASCGFGLSVAKLQYTEYRVKVGVLKISGELTGDIDGLALDARIAVDYDQTPCTKKLEHLKVTQFGKVRVHVTGLGPLNSLVSKLLSWVTKKWREHIVGQVENKLRKVAMQQLDKFDCERYRP